MPSVMKVSPEGWFVEPVWRTTICDLSCTSPLSTDDTSMVDRVNSVVPSTSAATFWEATLPITTASLADARSAMLLYNVAREMDPVEPDSPPDGEPPAVFVVPHAAAPPIVNAATAANPATLRHAWR